MALQYGVEQRSGAVQPQRTGKIDGLDGLRALAIIAVLVFHLRPATLPGGYLGVDLFFVVSGFLITTLLLRDIHTRGRLNLPRFWVRRARRLLPALALVVVVTIPLSFLVGDDLLVNIGRQTVGSLTFSNNWLEIVAGSDYFTHTSPVLFMNFWSLAVEEQFYLLWPIAFAAAMAFIRTEHGRLHTVLGAAAASALAMGMAFQLGASDTRVYYGTDTHLFGLMIGGALAFAWASPTRPLDSPRWQRIRSRAAYGSLAGLLLLMTTMGQGAAVTFRGGIALASLLAAVVIAGLLGGEGPLHRGLRWPPLRWLGERSYGLYLWHWPMILIVAATLPATNADSPLSWCSRALALGLSVLLSWASYRWVDMPVRELGFRHAADDFAQWVAQPWTQKRLPRLTAAALVVLIGMSVIAVASAPTKSTVQRQSEAGQNVAARSVVDAQRVAVPTADFSMPEGSDITAFGDSLVVTSSGGLTTRFPGIMLDAKSNRQWPAGQLAVQARLAEGTVRRAVILDFGTNAGVHDPQLVHNVINSLGPDRMIVLVNLFGSWEEDNPTLTAIAAVHPNVIIADWYAAISAQPGLLQPDRVHPGIKSAHLYADVIKDAFTQLSARLSTAHR